MNFAPHIDSVVLADYWLGVLSGDDEAVVEEHLLACDQCGDQLRQVMSLAEGIRRVARDGDLRMVVTDAFVRQMAAEGVRVREYALPSGGSVQCTVGEDDDMMIGRLAANLSDARRVDLCWYDEHGVEQLRLTDIPFRADAAGIVLHEPITPMKASPTTTHVARLLAVDETGTERLIGEFTFHHTRTLPGPGVG